MVCSQPAHHTALAGHFVDTGAAFHVVWVVLSRSGWVVLWLGRGVECPEFVHVSRLSPVQVYGISMDKPASQAKWREKEGISFNLFCDPDKEVSTPHRFIVY